MADSTILSAEIGLQRGTLDLSVRLSISQGEPLAVLGPNGSGKSSLLHALCGLTAIRRGQITLDDHVLDSPAQGVFVSPANRGIAVVFQDYRLFTWLSVRANLEFGARANTDSTQRRELVDGLLERFTLTQLATRRAGELSGGQSQRLAIARALAMQPRALLLDEPFSALDRDGGAQIRDVLDQVISGFGGPTLLVTHDVDDASRFCSQAIVLTDGRVVSAGAVADVVNRLESD